MSQRVFFPVETWDSNWMVGMYLDDLRIGEKQGEEDVTWYFTSSYNVPSARLLGFTYPDYLRYCRSKGAMIRGKKGYTIPVWTNKSDCDEICKMVEKEWKKLCNEIQFYIGQESYNRT